MDWWFLAKATLSYAVCTTAQFLLKNLPFLSFLPFSVYKITQKPARNIKKIIAEKKWRENLFLDIKTSEKKFFFLALREPQGPRASSWTALKQLTSYYKPVLNPFASFMINAV